MIYEKIMLGLSFAMPIGPVSAEAIRRGLMGGFMPAFRIKIGAAIGDTILLVVAYYGISAILEYQLFCSILSLCGSALLIFLGYKNIIKSFHPASDALAEQANLKNGWWLGLGIALTSPFALAWWLSVFAAILAQSNYNSSFFGLMENMYIIVGVILWDIVFCILLAGGHKIINNLFIKIINAAAGIWLCWYGVRFAVTALSKIFLH